MAKKTKKIGLLISCCTLQDGSQIDIHQDVDFFVYKNGVLDLKDLSAEEIVNHLCAIINGDI